jgi:hypothetical protein
MNWFAAQRLMATVKNPEKGKPIGNNTRLYFHDAGIGHESYYNIRLHGNQIMQIYLDRIVPMDGGWRTVTTKARLNEHLPQGFYVFQKNGDWFIQDMNTNADEATVYPFGDVYYIHNDNRVMLYSTHPKYSEVYGKDDVDWDEDFETGEEHQEYESAFDTNIDQELYSMRKGW